MLVDELVGRSNESSEDRRDGGGQVGIGVEGRSGASTSEIELDAPFVEMRVSVWRERVESANNWDNRWFSSSNSAILLRRTSTSN